MAINTAARRVPGGKELTFDEAGVRSAFPHLLSALAEYGQRVRDAYREELTLSNRPTMRDELRSTAEYVLEVGGMTLSVSLNVAAYWRNVEEGTKPHVVDQEKLAEWVRVKPVVPYAQANGRVPSVQRLAYLIQRKIAREGTVGSHDMARAIAATDEALELRIEQALATDLAEHFDELLNAFR